ncbi:MAG: CCA tRNA nucleotidyltransferase [Candidatus Moraniibacteriota bacterium]|nr:MAG: CCA tRNA nucleotidyltransferase [Candidatus Moranbacteria bacterium]
MEVLHGNMLPQPVRQILKTLNGSGYQAFVVGGSVRDLLLKRVPKDWDIATNATPEEIQTLFPESFYENIFGTVGIKVPPFSKKGIEQNATEEVIEATTFRAESHYEDNRHPSRVAFVKTIEEDLARRDFTINAMAIRLENSLKQTEDNHHIDLVLIDPFGGQEDIRHKTLRAVGDPDTRFAEDALRMLRAIRLLSELRTPTPLSGEPFMNERNESTKLHEGSDWHIDPETFSSLTRHAFALRNISAERISDELSKILLSENPAQGIDLLRISGLLQQIAPELEEGVGVGQNLHHIYTVYEHNLRALATCPSSRLEVRLAALLHDVGKPRTKRGNGYRSTFYNHDHVGARMTRSLLTRLRFPTRIVEQATLLVDNHLFYYNVEEVTAASVRRLIKRVGLENMRDLMHIRIADRLGSGTPKAKPYKLRHLEYMIEKVSNDPVSVKMLAVNGHDIMKALDIRPSPKIGIILDALLAEVIEDPEKNTVPFLLEQARILAKENEDALRARATEAIQEKRAEDEDKLKNRHRVS